MLRCRNCGAEASDWAARCPRCRASLGGALVIEAPAPTVQPEPVPAGPVQPEPVQPEAVPEPPPADGPPGRRLSRWGAPVAVLLVLGLVARVGVVVFHRNIRPPRRRAPALPAPLGWSASPLARYTLVDASSDRVLVVPLDGRPRHPVPGLPAGTPDAMMAVGPSFVVAVSGTVYSVASAVSGTAQRVGPGDGVFPSVWPDVFGYGAGAKGPTGTSTTSLAVASTSSPVPLSLRLPAGYRPVAHLGSDLLVSGPLSATKPMLRLWSLDPSPGGTFTRTFGLSRYVVGTFSTTVAWLAADGCSDQGECPLHITDVVAGTDRTVAPPPDHQGFLPGGAFGPGGGHIATFVAGTPANHPVAQLAIVDAGAATSSVVAGSDVQVGEPRGFATWTPEGAYVLFCGITGGLRAWNLRDGTVLQTDVPASYDIVAF